MKYELSIELSLYKEKLAVNELWILRAYNARGTFFPGNEVRLAQKYFFGYHRTKLTARRYGVLVCAHQTDNPYSITDALHGRKGFNSVQS